MHIRKSPQTDGSQAKRQLCSSVSRAPQSAMHAASVTSTPHSSERSQSCVQLFGSPEVVPAVVPLDSDSPAVPLELIEVEVGVAVEVDMEVDMEVVVSPSVALSVAPPPHATNISEATIAARAPRIIAQHCMPPTVPQPIAQVLVFPG